MPCTVTKPFKEASIAFSALKGYLIIIAIVFGLHFFIKAIDYSGLHKTKGKVVGHNYYRYGTIKGRGANMQYPIARFRDVDNGAGESEVTMEKVLNAIDLDSIDKFTLKSIILSKEREMKETAAKDMGYYTTKEPIGGMFFRQYKYGVTVSVIYEPSRPFDAIVCTFFSYWLTTKALMILLFVCAFFCGVHTIARYAGSEVSNSFSSGRLIVEGSSRTLRPVWSGNPWFYRFRQ